MKATEPSVNTLFSSTKMYRIPLYQRHYVWNSRNWEDLWNDIKAKSNLRDNNSAKTHFTGAIVISQDDEVEEESLEIIDGQQRLTTFQIILCVIRDTCNTFNNDPQGIARRAQGLIQNDPALVSEPSDLYKLLPREGADRDVFQSLVTPEEVETQENDRSGLIHPAYVHFKDEIKEYVAQDYDKLHNLFLSILNDFRVIQIMVGPDDEPEKIFQTINGTGRDLDEFDLLRNNLFLRARSGETRDELYRKYWHHFEEDSFWRTDGVVDHFLASVLMAKKSKYIYYDYHPERDREPITGCVLMGKRSQYLYYDMENAKNISLFDAYQTYRRELSEELNLDEDNFQFVEHEFQELSRYAQVYQKIRDPYSQIGCQLYDKLEMGGISEYISGSFINQLRQFILYIKNELRISDSLLTSVFDFMESLIVRFILCTGETVDTSYGGPEEGLFYSVFEHSIFSRLENHLLSNVLDINMMRNNPSSGELPDRFMEFEVFPPQVVEEALTDCDYYLRQGKIKASDYEHHKNYIRDTQEAEGKWCEFIEDMLYEIELMIAKEKGFTETDFKSMRGFLEDLSSSDNDKISVRRNPTGSIGNLTVCPSLWEVNDEWDVNQTRERERKLVEYFNKRWPSIQDCLDKIFETMERFKVQIINFIQDPQNQQYGVLEFSEAPEEDNDERFTKLFGEEPRKIYVHISQGPNKNFHSLQPGQKIEFSIDQTENGLYARNIAARGGLYEMIQAEKRNLIRTYEGTRELSQIVVHDTYIEGVACNDKREVVLDKNSILFVCSATDWSTLKPCIQENAEVKERAFGPIQSPSEKFQVNDWILNNLKYARYTRFSHSEEFKVVAVTRSGHVLRGSIEDFNEDAIDMRINKKSVIVFKQSLHQFETMERFKVQIINFIQDPQNQQYGVLEFSKAPEKDDDERFTKLFGEEPRRIYVHISQCPNKDFHLLQPSQEIKFNIAQTENGLYARNITLFDSAPQRRRQPRRR